MLLIVIELLLEVTEVHHPPRPVYYHRRAAHAPGGAIAADDLKRTLMFFTSVSHLPTTPHIVFSSSNFQIE